VPAACPVEGPEPVAAAGYGQSPSSLTCDWLVYDVPLTTCEADSRTAPKYKQPAFTSTALAVLVQAVKRRELDKQQRPWAVPTVGIEGQLMIFGLVRAGAGDGRSGAFGC
jgi:hypothetical protein